MNRTQIGTHSKPGGSVAAATIRHAEPADLAALHDFFAGLSVRSRYLRFFVPITPGDALLRRMSGGTEDTDVLVIVHDGVIIGHAMAVDRDEPGGERATDIGVVVADGWQGQGIGAALMRELIRRAGARGVRSLILDVLPGNHQALAMIVSHWTPSHIDRTSDSLSVRIRLPRPVAHHRHPRAGRPAVKLAVRPPVRTAVSVRSAH